MTAPEMFKCTLFLPLEAVQLSEQITGSNSVPSSDALYRSNCCSKSKAWRELNYTLAGKKHELSPHRPHKLFRVGPSSNFPTEGYCFVHEIPTSEIQNKKGHFFELTLPSFRTTEGSQVESKCLFLSNEKVFEQTSNTLHSENEKQWIRRACLTNLTITILFDSKRDFSLTPTKSLKGFQTPILDTKVELEPFFKTLRTTFFLDHLIVWPF